MSQRSPVTALIVLLVLGSMVITPTAWLYTDLLWFQTVGQEQVFGTVIVTRLGLFLAGALTTFLFLYGNAAYALRLTRNRPVLLPKEWAGTFAAEVLTKRNALQRILGWGSAGVSVFVGLGVQNWWHDTLGWFHATEFGYVEPILGMDAGFYVFTLPMLEHLKNLIAGLLFLSAAISLACYLVRGTVRVMMQEVDGQIVTQGLRADPGPRRHLASLAAAFTITLAFGVHLDRFEILFDQGGLFPGPGYTDVYARLPLLTVQAIGLAVAAFLVFQAIDQLRGGWFALAVVVVLITRGGAALIPNLVQQVSVLPNELERETPYIVAHIKATREAFGLQHVEERPLTGEAELTAQDIENNRVTINNVRLWDHAPLLDTFSQLQEIRTYYDFINVDNDRYMIDGELRQVMLSARELVSTSLPEQARTWVNQSMTYTHGYGLALGPVNLVNDQGLPVLFVKDLPPVVTHEEDLGIKRPEIYFGEAMRNPVFVNTTNPEFDYPSGEENAYTEYSGTGGVPMDGLFKRAAFAMRLSDFNVLLSGDITNESKVLLYRDIVERAKRVVPFLAFDNDPYMVILDGRLVWMIDAHSIANRYPYSQAVQVGELKGNWIRNSVKVVVDAYDGSLTFYRMSGDDPVLDTWAKAFPHLFEPADRMPANLWAHLRYPQDLFEVQSNLFAVYHMTNAQIFYYREDEWEVPTLNLDSGTRYKARMEPYYTIMKLPGEDKEEFIVMLPFTPKSKPNLAAWMVGRSDGEAYGQMIAYKFKKDKMVYGPNMVVARINQDDKISEKLSLWNQQGSEVLLGTLLVIPVEESLLYIQPLYLRAESGSIPELKRVIVAYQDDIAMESTLEESLARLFDMEPERTAPEVKSSETGEPISSDDDSLVLQARSTYEAAITAQREGRWSDYGEYITTLGVLIAQLAGEDVPSQQELERSPDEADPEAIVTPLDADSPAP